MVRMRKWCRWAVCLFRQNYATLAKCTILWLLLVGILHYGYVCKNWDLLWWKQQLTGLIVGPMMVLLYIIVLKVSLILLMTLWSYTKKVDKEQQKKEQPISAVKRRYRRFIMMRLLEAVEELLHRPLDDFTRPWRVQRRFLKRRSKFIKEVELFLWSARKLYERTDDQLYLPLHQVLLVDDQREEQLLQLGYGERLTSLKDVDIHRMVYG
ncbi:uncharacterized protein DMAD_06744 [Drosophila madeirensis]|uniref:Uncharacterized protein n=1 Tax=Drosophila madeirensis TaxID=30013 RepID=A0AAU9FTL3_DROMD